MDSKAQDVSDSDSNSTLCSDVDETSPLLETQPTKPSYVTFSKRHREEANVFLSGFDMTITASTYAAISSEFGAANNAAWLTTWYLITSTAFQPLYGRLSDLFGRRLCFFVSTVTFMAGCLRCSLAQDMLTLNMMRALAGFGGGGLITMATVINSDMIPFKQRGMYQAMQNILHRFGFVLGASLGGTITETVGWRWCFLSQMPVSLVTLVVGYFVLENALHLVELTDPKRRTGSALQCLHLSGAILLVVGLAVQLLGLSFGGNECPWSSMPAKTNAMPMIPLRMLQGWQSSAVQLSNIFSGMAAYAYMFMIPLHFQAVQGDSPCKAGLRLVMPAGARLSYNVRLGTAMMLLGNMLAVTLATTGDRQREFVFLVPATLGLGLTNPSILFSFVSLFEHRGKLAGSVATSTTYPIRSMGSIYCVTITSAIVQNVLMARLPATDELVEKLHKSVFALRELSPELEKAVRALLLARSVTALLSNEPT
ncbi:major facilitator superfamily domain-containing protein [Pseudoneurospora amorphoporcata]|uniref:Major facilitator superfamily domain-containing protein n=1 Tax=Pseudoneurospora amorphoporcata TaxID=241081 RepID=A0AAN6NLS8_9PEZI|nr:major facilitator superfamily domain-containing protein [Pseudoneurospora amorphoporcata]